MFGSPGYLEIDLSETTSTQFYAVAPFRGFAAQAVDVDSVTWGSATVAVEHSVTQSASVPFSPAVEFTSAGLKVADVTDSLFVRFVVTPCGGSSGKVRIFASGNAFDR